MRRVPIYLGALLAVFLALPGHLTRAETQRREAVERPDPPEVAPIEWYTRGADGWLFVAAFPGPGDFARPAPNAAGPPGPRNYYPLNLTTQTARFSVCPVWRVPDCGTSSPGAASPLTGTGMFEFHGYIAETGDIVLCPSFIKGEATVTDEDGKEYRVSFHELWLTDARSGGCGIVQQDLEIPPER